MRAAGGGPGPDRARSHITPGPAVYTATAALWTRRELPLGPDDGRVSQAILHRGGPAGHAIGRTGHGPGKDSA